MFWDYIYLAFIFVDLNQWTDCSSVGRPQALISPSLSTKTIRITMHSLSCVLELLDAHTVCINGGIIHFCLLSPKTWLVSLTLLRPL